MLSFLQRKARREACRQLMVELFQYNRKDACWDPIGSIDRNGLDATIESIAQGKLKERSVREAKEMFNRRKKNGRR